MIKKRFSEKLKGQKGSITLFVLISIIFFLIVLISIYISSGNKEQSQVSEIKAIQEEYNVSPEELQKEYQEIVNPDDGIYNISYILNGGTVSGNPSTYTEESYAVLQTAVAEADAVMADENARQNEVDDAVESVQAAMNGLVTEEGEITEPIEKNATQTGQETTTTKANTAKTGDVIPIAGIISLVLAGSILILSRKKE